MLGPGRCGYRRAKTTVRVADGEPGGEGQIGFGRMCLPDAQVTGDDGRRVVTAFTLHRGGSPGTHRQGGEGDAWVPRPADNAHYGNVDVPNDAEITRGYPDGAMRACCVSFAHDRMSSFRGAPAPRLERLPVRKTGVARLHGLRSCLPAACQTAGSPFVAKGAQRDTPARVDSHGLSCTEANEAMVAGGSRGDC